MPSLNKVLLMGHLGRDPEVKYMPNGEPVCNVSLATSESWKNKDGKREEKTEWHNLVAYRKTAEIMGQYLKKGASVYVEGRIETRKWQDKEGKDRYTTQVVVTELKMLDGRPKGETDVRKSQRNDDQDIPF